VAHGRAPEDADRQDQLFSLIFSGRGAQGVWTEADWGEYRANKKALWSGEVPWPAGDLAPGYNRFALHLKRLGDRYGNSRESATRFTRATGLIWGGIAYEGSAFVALFRAGAGDHLPQLEEGPAGWRPEHVDDTNPAHHWVAAFVAGFAYGALAGAVTNTVRDLTQLVAGMGGTMADIRLGNVAARHGAYLRRASRARSALEPPYRELLAIMDRDLLAETQP
jgi:hypothetical protein